jgi:SAM-dependent methyltransferase
MNRIIVCYCADISVDEIESAVELGFYTIDDIKKYLNKIQSGNCKEKNPKGTCCDTDFESVIKNKIKTMENKNLKEVVKQKYGEIANQTKFQNERSCCGVNSGCCSVDYTIFSENYEKIQGYNSDADLGLGCGLPTEFAKIKKGDTVIDLGSGAGNDCFVARAIAGEEGQVIGIDFTEAMINKAIENADKLGFKNVQFRLGDIEKMPVTANKADVIISNCVLNLVPDKQKAFSEIFRVLKCNGHFSISDVVLIGKLPENIAKAAEMYAGCVSGAIQKEEYLSIIENAGFTELQIQKEKSITIPDEILLKYLTNSELEDFKKQNVGIFSITVYGEKPDCECEKC